MNTAAARPVAGPLLVALTGGIASGKSRVADLFVECGAELIDSDAIAHQLTAAGGPAIPALVAAFGGEVLDSSGALDRVRMRDLAFRDPAVRHSLEQVLHDPIRRASAAALTAARAPYVLWAIPLFVEAGPRSPAVDRVLVVDCPEVLQRERALTRPGLTAAQLDGILAAQASRTERLAVADDVIDNSGSIAALLPQVRALDARYRQLSGEARP
jgi:dephospho-CoA kinase